MAEHFGDLFKEYLQRQGVTPAPLAQRTGLPKETIINWRKGRVRQPQRWQDIALAASALEYSRRRITFKHKRLATELMLAVSPTVLSKIIFVNMLVASLGVTSAFCTIGRARRVVKHGSVESTMRLNSNRTKPKYERVLTHA